MRQRGGQLRQDADQRGSSGANFVISEDRARAVVSHLVDYGIEGSRLSSRAAEALAYGLSRTR